jgi:hypothetical protein
MNHLLLKMIVLMGGHPTSAYKGVHINVTV